MADCECLVNCPFFNNKMDPMKGVGQVYKKKFCRGDNTQCARYMVFEKLGKSAVPDNLYPNMQEKALMIIDAES